MDVLALESMFNDGIKNDESEQSSVSSSMKELSTADEHGLRTSFRAIRRDVTTPTDVKVHVYSTPRDVTMETPDSVVSTGSRAFMHSNNKQTFFNAGHLQQQYNQAKHSATTNNELAELHTKNRGTADKFANSLDDVKQSQTDTNFSLKKSMRHVIRKENSASDEKDRMETWVTTPSTFEHSHSYNQSLKYDNSDKLYQEKTEKNNPSCFPKLALFCALILLLLGGIVALIIFKKEPSGDRRLGNIIIPSTEKPKPVFKEICKDVKLKLREQIMFSCSLVKADVAPYEITDLFITPPIYYNEGKRFYVSLESKTDQWETEIDHMYRTLMIRGPATTCTTQGRFQLEFYDKKKSRFNTSMQIEVVSEVLRVNVSLSQGGDNNPDDFVLGCSTNSGCESSTVDFFAEIENVTQQLMGVNFTCIVKYDDYNGYSVACLGTIPDFLLSKFEKITCKPKSSLLDVDDEDEKSVEIELPECDLTNHCGYKCLDDTDYYAVSSERCDIFHRCYKSQPFTSYCAPGTFFDTNVCACRHTSELPWCQQNGALKPNANVKGKTCEASENN